MYVVFLKDVKCADSLKYGREEYDFQVNTLVFTSPGQVFGYPADGSTYKAKGWCLYFSPELLHGTPLGRHIKDYTFFSYDVKEALHISQQERETIIDCLKKIDNEINANPDRQFATRKAANKDILTRFEHVLDGYFSSVAFCADQLHLSANYFGDLIKKETGRSAKDYVQKKIMDTAKTMLSDHGRSISEIAYALGYQYPQYFSRAFKNVVGCTPKEYRTLRV